MQRSVANLSSGHFEHGAFKGCAVHRPEVGGLDRNRQHCGSSRARSFALKPAVCSGRGRDYAVRTVRIYSQATDSRHSLWRHLCLPFANFSCRARARGMARARISFAGPLKGRAVDEFARQIMPQIGVEHPEIGSHARVGRVSWRPMCGASTCRAVPQVERAITLLVGNAYSFHTDKVRSAVMPKPGGAPAYRAVAFSGFDRLIAES